MEGKKVIVNATLSQLVDIGIDYDIRDHNGLITHDFDETGWYEVEISYVHDHKNNKFISKFDIPKDLLKII